MSKIREIREWQRIFIFQFLKFLIIKLEKQDYEQIEIIFTILLSDYIKKMYIFFKLLLINYY